MTTFWNYEIGAVAVVKDFLIRRCEIFQMEIFSNGELVERLRTKKVERWIRMTISIDEVGLDWNGRLPKMKL